MKKPNKFNVISLTPNNNLCIVDDFLTNRECATLIKMAKKKGLESYEKAYKLGFKNKGKMETVSLFPTAYNKTIKDIEERITKLTLIPLNQGECIKIINYEKGAAHSPHYDMLCDRILTFLIYLNDVEEGGETTYPEIGIKVIPKKGRALLMYHCHGYGLPKKGEKTLKLPKKLIVNERESYHGGGKVYEGEKWVFAKFYRSTPVDGTIQELIETVEEYKRPEAFLTIPLSPRKKKSRI